jgi:hypothetical protein
MAVSALCSWQLLARPGLGLCVIVNPITHNPVNAVQCKLQHAHCFRLLTHTSIEHNHVAEAFLCIGASKEDDFLANLCNQSIAYHQHQTTPWTPRQGGATYGRSGVVATRIRRDASASQYAPNHFLCTDRSTNQSTSHNQPIGRSTVVTYRYRAQMSHSTQSFRHHLQRRKSCFQWQWRYARDVRPVCHNVATSSSTTTNNNNNLRPCIIAIHTLGRYKWVWSNAKSLKGKMVSRGEEQRSRANGSTSVEDVEVVVVRRAIATAEHKDLVVDQRGRMRPMRPRLLSRCARMRPEHRV